MKLCRYDEDRLGVVIGDKVHDVTEAQSLIRAGARYDMKGDAVIAALPAWRKRIEDMAAKAPSKAVAEVKLISPVARPSKNMAAPTTEISNTKRYWVTESERWCTRAPRITTTSAMTRLATTCTDRRLVMMAHVDAGVTRNRWKTPFSRSRAIIRARKR